MKENKVYIGLGTNLGNRSKNLDSAIKEIEEFSKIIKKSSVYETEPVGYKDQELFLNMVIEIITELSPVELIINLKEIEHKMGRKKEFLNRPR
ncbi:2-amino-4-hydroxy-6-hydroxymethyldihydropteridine diphosphokinase, partial [Candidatus Peregrinibacteria bacterium]|nr:2-amino-4-hydroxy-6-hydroxymethyldihydropteridine diphosphokinase [Candidatus Peregrinibacteria bacterium]